jgi:acetamidase/formamidase
MSAHHTLRAEAGTVHRGAFDPTLAPVLTIASGDVVDVTTLSGNPDQIPPPELGFTVLPEHRDVLARVPAGEGPHFLTGPIAVDGAMPGDELVVDVVDMRLAQDWGWNRFAPGMGRCRSNFQMPDASTSPSTARPPRSRCLGD